MKAVFTATIGLGLLCVLIIAATAGPASDGLRYRVKLNATVTKEWNTSVASTEEGCRKLTHAVGRRTISIRSTRPTRVTARPGRRVTFSPSAVRYLAVTVTESGGATIDRGVPPTCTGREVRRSDCPRSRRVLGGRSVRFFRSRKNELSFARASPLTAIAGTCPSELAQVRSIRPGLHQADGEVSEASFGRPGAGPQTAFGSFEQTTTLAGSASGTVVERVRWTLTFAPG